MQYSTATNRKCCFSSILSGHFIEHWSTLYYNQTRVTVVRYPSREEIQRNANNKISDAICTFIMDAGVTSRTVENHKIISTISIRDINFQPTTQMTASRTVTRLCESLGLTVSDCFMRMLGVVSLLTDAWSSCIQCGDITVPLSWVDHHLIMQKTLLDFVWILARHNALKTLTLLYDISWK